MYSWNDKDNIREKLLLFLLTVGITILLLMDTFIQKVLIWDRITIFTLLVLFLIICIITILSNRGRFQRILLYN